MAARKQSVSVIVNDHWQQFGRNYYTRHDYEAIPSDIAQKMMADVENGFSSLVGQTLANRTVRYANNFSYHDPVDRSHSSQQGLRIGFDDGARLIYRLSGTGTEGATLRVYIESYESDRAQLNIEPQTALADLIAVADELAGISSRTGRTAPTVIT